MFSNVIIYSDVQWNIAIYMHINLYIFGIYTQQNKLRVT